jgi:hypothetical protein
VLRSVRLIGLAGRCSLRPGVYARPPIRTRRLEGSQSTFQVSTFPLVDKTRQGNILISKEGRACLADFGLTTIARMTRQATANISTASAASLLPFIDGGTSRWMSPELLHPDKSGAEDSRPTTQSDCYALGMVIYEVGDHLPAPDPPG